MLHNFLLFLTVHHQNKLNVAPAEKHPCTIYVFQAGSWDITLHFKLLYCTVKHDKVNIHTLAYQVATETHYYSLVIYYPLVWAWTHPDEEQEKREE